MNTKDKKVRKDSRNKPSYFIGSLGFWEDKPCEYLLSLSSKEVDNKITCQSLKEVVELINSEQRSKFICSEHLKNYWVINKWKTKLKDFSIIEIEEKEFREVELEMKKSISKVVWNYNEDIFKTWINL